MRSKKNMNRRSLWLVLVVPCALLVVWTVRPLTVGQATEESSNSREQAISEMEALKRLSEALVIQMAQEKGAEKLQGMKDEGLHKLDAEWRDIDSYVASERARIEAWYSRSLAELQAEGERRLAQLEGEKKAAYARSLQEMKNTTKVSEKRVTENSYGRANVYVDVFGRGVVDSYETTYGREIEATHTSVKGDPTADYEKALDRLRESEQVTERDLQWARNRLDRVRQYKLIDFEKEAQRRRDVVAWKRRCVSKEAQQAASDSGTPLTEVTPRIQAICFSGNGKSSIYVRGRFAREGDIVDGFRILRIYSDRVEFEKNGETITAVLPPPQDH
jgi:hypothetical protein